MIALSLALAAQIAAVQPRGETLLVLPKSGVSLALRDLTGDGALDLVRVDADELALFPMRASGTYAAEPSARLPWPASRVGWELQDLDGDGACEVLLVLGDGIVRAHRADAAGAFGAAAIVLESVAQLPSGVHRVQLARDVDGDGHTDIVLTGPGSHRIHLARDEGFAAPIEVAYELDASYDVGDPGSLSASVGQSVSVPWFTLMDVDGDGRQDLVSETSERIAFHLAAPELSSEPSWSLDLAALEVELPKRAEIDLDDLFANVDAGVRWQIADLDGVAPNDLIITLGSKFRVYLGGSVSGPDDSPDQVLKSSGNVLLSFVRRVDADARPDLQVIRGERISVGRVLRMLVLPSSLDFDIFTYTNEGGPFSKRPTRRNTVTIEVPRLLALIEDGGAIQTALEAQFDVRARRLPRIPGAPAAGDDVADVVEGHLVILPSCAPAPALIETIERDELDGLGFVESFCLRDLDERGDGATRTLDLGDLASLDLAPGAILRAAAAGVAPLLRHPLAVPTDKVVELMARDLDGDGSTDVIVIGETDDEWVVQFVVR